MGQCVPEGATNVSVRQFASESVIHQLILTVNLIPRAGGGIGKRNETYQSDVFLTPPSEGAIW